MMPMLLVPPAAEPLALDDAKGFARIDEGEDDTLVQALIVAARLHVEAVTRQLLVAQEWRCWLEPGETRLPLAPVRAVTVVGLVGADGAVVPLDPTAWRAEPAGAPQRLRPAGAAAGVLQVDLAVGFGGPDEVPEPLRQAMRLMVSAWYDDRAYLGFGSGEAVLPPGAAALLAPWRRPRL